ncbi:MAG: hypothetical protein R3C51_14775 [Parvularculaceae bacterium]
MIEAYSAYRQILRRDQGAQDVAACCASSDKFSDHSSMVPDTGHESINSERRALSPSVVSSRHEQKAAAPSAGVPSGAPSTHAALKSEAKAGEEIIKKPAARK